MSSPTASVPGPTADDFVAYEYARVRAPRRLEPLYLDTYRSFGWALDEIADDRSGAGELVFKRDRSIRNRPMVHELQRKAVGSLNTIGELEKAKSATPGVVAFGLGLLGCVPLAGSVFMIVGGAGGFVATALGVVGLAIWGAVPLLHRKLKASRTARLDARIEAEQDVIFDAAEQAARLLH